LLRPVVDEAVKRPRSDASWYSLDRAPTSSTALRAGIRPCTQSDTVTVTAQSVKLALG